jgi:hypothetical protein
MDPEIKAMTDVVGALTPLEPEAVARVITWAAERFSVQLARGGRPKASASDLTGVREDFVAQPKDFADFHELFDAANPSTGPDKALLAGYWFQVVQGQDDLESQQLNSELKNLGHPSTNITRDFGSLINRSPRYVMQVRKEGNSKQARKKYKLTREGIKAVERMLRGSAADPADASE